MIRNYIKVACRNLFKNKAFSFINIFGLAIGMTVAILNGLWIWDELSFNQYHKNYGRITQVMLRSTYQGEEFTNHTMSYPFAAEVQNVYNGSFSHVVKASWVSEYILSAGEAKLSRKGQFMDEGAPDMLSLKMICGSRAGLRDPYSIMLSASTAKALFGDTNPVDKIVRINNENSVKVTGVFEDLPLNSEFNAVKFFSPWKLWEANNDWVQQRAINEWNNHFLRLYVELKPGVSIEQATHSIKGAERQYQAHADLPPGASAPQALLWPMSKWHLSGFERGRYNDKPIRFVWMVGIIGMFVLLLACINFMNLSTARSARRAKEVGIRKAIGSVRWQLVKQFFSESLLIAVLAFVLAIVSALLLLPWFNQLSAKAISMPWGNPWFWLCAATFIFLTGLLAGSYPALYLSSFQPVKVLKGTFRAGRFAATPRKALVVLQFTVSVILAIATMVVYRQIRYAKDRPVGYTREGLLMVEMKSADFYGKNELLSNELKRTGVVAEMAASMGRLTEIASGNNGFNWRGADTSQLQNFGTLVVTPEYGKTIGWQFVAGRDFSKELGTDSAGMVINESAAKSMGLQSPVGEDVTWKWRDAPLIQYKILGVVKDMVMESPYAPAEPTFFFLKAPNGGYNYLHIKVKPNVSMSQALAKIEGVFKTLIPTAPFDYTFADEEYALKFAAEERIEKLATFFAVLALFISCLGLFGLASFVAEQRTKEIGIRKVLGASVFNLWRLLSRDFVVLVLLSCAIATPVAGWLLIKWLQQYAYRTEVSWWLLAAVAAGALAITLLTVSFQSVKAALMNPVKSLRTE
ncbi:MAG TPA: ABC transporter permease [Chitinophaga sp.]